MPPGRTSPGAGRPTYMSSKASSTFVDRFRGRLPKGGAGGDGPACSALRHPRRARVFQATRHARDSSRIPPPEGRPESTDAA